MTHTAHYIVQSRVYLRDGIAVYIAIVRRRPRDDMTRRIGYNVTRTVQDISSWSPGSATNGSPS